MKTRLLIVLTLVVLGVGSTLATINNASRAVITPGALRLRTSGTTRDSAQLNLLRWRGYSARASGRFSRVG